MGKSKKETEIHKVDTQEPWAQALPYLNNTLAKSNQVFNSDAGTKYFPGSTSTPMSWDTSYGLDAIRNRALGGSPLTEAAQDQMLNTINGDYFNPTNNFYNSAMNGGLNNQSAGLYNRFMGYNNSPANGYFADLSGSANPYLDQTFNNASSKISDQVNANFSKAGRYGSAAHQGKLTDDLGKLANDLYGGAYQGDQNRRLSAANSMQNSYDSHMNRAMNATNSLSGLEDQNIARAMAGAGAFNQNFQSERERQLRAMYGAPDMAVTDYADYDRLLNVGKVNENQARNDLNAEIEKFKFYESLPFNRTALNAGLAQQYARLGGTNTTNGNTIEKSASTGNFLGDIAKMIAIIP